MSLSGLSSLADTKRQHTYFFGTNTRKSAKVMHLKSIMLVTSTLNDTYLQILMTSALKNHVFSFYSAKLVHLN